MKKIEVLWTITEGEVETDKWWPATIVGRTSTEHQLSISEEEGNEPSSLDKLPIYEIRYDAFPPDFPDPQISSVCILDDHHILDTESDSTLSWRHEGSTWEPKDEDEESNEDLEKREIPSVVLEELKRLEESGLNNDGQAKECAIPKDVSIKNAQEFVNKLIGELTIKHSQQLNNLPMSNQMAIVDKIKILSDKLVGKVADILSSKGCLSPEDARDIVQELRGG